MSVPNAQAAAHRPRVLLVTATTGYYHESIPTAHTALRDLAARTGAFELSILPTVAELPELTAERLGATDVLLFASTTGDLPLDGAQRGAILQFVQRGGGFVGAHSATATLGGWPAYGDLLGAVFREHPWVQEGRVVVEDREHPATRHLDAAFATHDEFYVFHENPRPRVRVLLSLDPSSVGAAGDYPLAWCKRYGDGRVFYTSLGHFTASWRDERFLGHVAGGLAWAAGAAG